VLIVLIFVGRCTRCFVSQSRRRMLAAEEKHFHRGYRPSGVFRCCTRHGPSEVEGSHRSTVTPWGDFCFPPKPPAERSRQGARYVTVLSNAATKASPAHAPLAAENSRRCWPGL